MLVNIPKAKTMQNKDFFLLALDAGKHGALAWWDSTRAFPNVTNLALGAIEIQAQIGRLPIPDGTRRVAVLEEVGGFIGIPQPGSRMFEFGRAFGHVEGALAAHNFEIHKVRPRTWQKSLSALSRPGEDKTSHKRRLGALARELTPILKDKITLQNADAVLLLHFGLEKFANGSVSPSETKR